MPPVRAKIASVCNKRSYNGGGSGIRTRDLLHAMQALSRPELCPHQLGRMARTEFLGPQENVQSLSEPEDK